MSRQLLPVLLATLASLSAWAAAEAPRAEPAKRPPLSQVLRGEALERYEAARQDFKSQRYAPALAGFVRAHALSNEPRLRWNAAACLRKLERNAEALRHLDAYLKEAAAELTADELAEARRAQTAVRELVATITLSTTPEDVSVTVDGTSVEAGGGLYVEPGRHAFRFSSEGYADRLREEALRAGEAVTWTIALEPVRKTEVAPPPPQLTSPPQPRRWAPWLVAGGGVVVGATGGLLVGLAGGDYARLKTECGTMCPPQRWAGARDREVAGLVMIGVGAAAVGAGLGWWAWSSASGDTSARVVVGPGQVSLEGRF